MNLTPGDLVVIDEDKTWQDELVEKHHEEERTIMKPDFEYGDIVIKRVLNGWIVYSGSEYNEDHVVTTVYEDDLSKWGSHEALIHLIREQFSDQVQQKKYGGIKLEVRDKGYSDDYDDEAVAEYQKQVGEVFEQVIDAANRAVNAVFGDNKESLIKENKE